MDYVWSLVRVLTALLLVSFIVAGTRVIDADVPAFSSVWKRLAVVGAILFATAGAITVLHSLLSPANAGIGLDLEPDGKGPPFRRGLLVAAGAALLFIVVAVIFQKSMGIPLERTLLMGFAVGMGWAALAKPWWFWEHWKAQILRRLVGDSVAKALYLVMALLLMYAALFGEASEMLK